MNVRTPCMPCLTLALLGIVSFVATAQHSEAAPSLQTVQETYRLRIENIQYGRVEISIDGGRRYILLGRVLHPATATAAEKNATTPSSVLRGSGFGLVLTTTPGNALKLRPFAPVAPTGKGKKPNAPPAADPAAIVTNLEPESGLFADLLPPDGSPVRVQIGEQEAAPFPSEYTPATEDVLSLSVQLPLPPLAAGAPPRPESERLAAFRTELKKRVEALGDAYARGAVARAEAEKRKIVSGSLIIRPKLSPDEIAPIKAVSFFVDNDPIATTTVAPYTHEWETRDLPDGEHVLEIRALNEKGGFVTRIRLLLVIRNTIESTKQKPPLFLSGRQ
ncbi:MAG TPA: Ig-like domain-containing protein [Chthonomonadaceae bacterium]|nr:Ig-like domain-containing protein [Chthonomonadaceae bacterium]